MDHDQAYGGERHPLARRKRSEEQDAAFLSGLVRAAEFHGSRVAERSARLRPLVEASARSSDRQREEFYRGAES